MMRKSVICGVCCAIAVLFSLFDSSKTDSQSEKEYKAQATWVKQFDSVEELVKEIDIVVFGKVISQSVEKREDMVFTRSIVEVDKEYKGEERKYYEIVQTGGELEGTITTEIEGDPIFELGDQMVLMLELTDYDPEYGQYCLTIGGGQGVYSITPKSNNIEDLVIELASEKVNQAKDTSGDWHVPYIWYKNPVTFSVSGLSGVYLTAAREGFTSWNSGCKGISYNYTASAADVPVTYKSYGATNWYGYTYANDNGGTQVLCSAPISLNSYTMSTLDTYAFRAIVCHEAGHALGIAGHADKRYTVSIMYPNGEEFMNSYNTPRSADFQIINEGYGYY